MRVEIIDDTHQRFNGVTYRKNKRGWYQTPYSTIHRDVWKFFNGEIPPNHDVHHIDFDKANNQIENLQLMTTHDHRQLHHPKIQHDLTCAVCGKHFQSDDKNRKRCPECLAEYKRQCEEKRQAKLNPPPKAPKPSLQDKACVICGKVFHPKHAKQKCCSPECGAKFTAISNRKERVVSYCEFCGKEIIHRPSETPRFCSQACLNRFMSVSRKKS